MHANCMKRCAATGPSIALCLLLYSQAPHADGLTLNAGVDYSSGKYGTGRSTNVVYLPFSAKYDAGPLSYRLTIPWISVTGAGDIIPGGLGGAGSGVGAGLSDISGSSGGVAGAFGCTADNRGGASRPEDNGPCTNTASGGAPNGSGSVRRRTTESGIGDIVAAVTYNALNTTGGLSIDLTGKIKFPTASESRGLGSGKIDYAAQLNAEQSFGQPSIFFGLGYKWLGDPQGTHLDNVWYGALGGAYKFSRDTTAGLSFDWATAATDGTPSARELSLYASHWLNDHMKLNGTLYTGLSDSSPDAGAGLSLSYAF